LCIDAIPFLFRSAGVKSYLHHWVRHLERVSATGRARLSLFPYLGIPTNLDHEHSARSRVATLPRIALWKALNVGPQPLLDWLAPDADVFHATKFRSSPRRASLTATLYDATCWLHPEMHTAANIAAEKHFAASIWKRADGLIAISENTRADAVRLLGLDSRRIRVIYPGVAESYFDVPAAAIEQVRNSYDLPSNYLLYVGTIEPRKNVAMLLDAYSALPRDVRNEFKLVIAGPAGWSSDPLLSRLRTLDADVRYLGYVPEALMPGLFAGASLFAYISVYEGFGLPVAQAMAAGVAVLTSCVSSLPEVTGGAAELVDPRSVDAVRDALLRLLTSPERRSTLSLAGRRRASHFLWDRCASLSLDFFEEVIGRRGA
jgi:alpha-1,3-rhamnosyl/mannosyltransferase